MMPSYQQQKLWKQFEPVLCISRPAMRSNKSNYLTRNCNKLLSRIPKFNFLFDVCSNHWVWFNICKNPTCEFWSKKMTWTLFAGFFFFFTIAWRLQEDYLHLQSGHPSGEGDATLGPIEHSRNPTVGKVTQRLQIRFSIATRWNLKRRNEKIRFQSLPSRQANIGHNACVDYFRLRSRS